MKRKLTRDPRHLPNPDELRKTTEPLDEQPENAPPDDAAIKRPQDRPNRPAHQ
jgi:hypothetical protein